MIFNLHIVNLKLDLMSTLKGPIILVDHPMMIGNKICFDTCEYVKTPLTNFSKLMLIIDLQSKNIEILDTKTGNSITSTCRCSDIDECTNYDWGNHRYLFNESVIAQYYEFIDCDLEESEYCEKIIFSNEHITITRTFCECGDVVHHIYFKKDDLIEQFNNLKL